MSQPSFTPVLTLVTLTLVTGGARSGKSRFAEARATRLAQRTGQPVTYLATAQAFDAEMTERIQRHQHDRPAQWVTLEEPLEVAQCAARAPTPTLLLDCLSLWVSNMMLADYTDERILSETRELLKVLAQRPGPSVLVTNEVGWGIVPDNALARRYRDVLGWVNQLCAAQAGEAYLVVCGRPLLLGPVEPGPAESDLNLT